MRDAGFHFFPNGGLERLARHVRDGPGAHPTVAFHEGEDPAPLLPCDMQGRQEGTHHRSSWDSWTQAVCCIQSDSPPEIARPKSAQGRRGPEGRAPDTNVPENRRETVNLAA